MLSSGLRFLQWIALSTFWTSGAWAQLFSRCVARIPTTCGQFAYLSGRPPPPSPLPPAPATPLFLLVNLAFSCSMRSTPLTFQKKNCGPSIYFNELLIYSCSDHVVNSVSTNSWFACVYRSACSMHCKCFAIVITFLKVLLHLVRYSIDTEGLMSSYLN